MYLSIWVALKVENELKDKGTPDSYAASPYYTDLILIGCNLINSEDIEGIVSCFALF